MTSSTAEIVLKEQQLREVLRSCRSVVIGFSGGVDSSYLAKAALDALPRNRVLAVTGRSPSYPKVQRDMALEVARVLDLPHLEIETGELGDPNYASNPADRCYFCKSELYGELVAVARARGFVNVLDGSNADDLDDYRPGSAAAHEMEVRSPLQEVGLSKDEIRWLSQRAGLPTWDVPASPCLASRIAYGLPVTPERLVQIESVEARLRDVHAWQDLRVRHHGDLARLEVVEEDLARLVDPNLRGQVVAALREAGFERACLDLAGYRRGALNEALERGAADS
jgi:uncharacterized protein